ncbi:MAG TPA: FkbM family methyltransferase [Pyrinomonadaceae bacterium]
MDSETQLEELLAEPAAQAQARMAAQARAGARADDVYALYGAGQLGRAVLAKLRAAGVEPAAFADDTPEKQGQIIEGLPVMTPRAAAERFGPRLVFVVTILNPLLNYVTARRRLQAQTGARVVSFLHLAWRYPAQFLPLYQFEPPADVLAKAADIRAAFRLFADEESRRQFAAHLRFRLRLEHDALPACAADDYFPPDVLPEPLPPDAVFVDCGAYDGDTLRAFLTHQRGRFGGAYLFEPDAANCARLRAYVAALGAEAAARVRVFNAGVGARRGALRFDAAGNMSSAVSATGATEIEIVPLDEVVAADDAAPVYLKFDVEGAEWDALAGCAELLRRARPLMAISAYHRPDDLWQLPRYVAALGLGYRLHLRTQGEDGMDAILYALPEAQSGGR